MLCYLQLGYNPATRLKERNQRKNLEKENTELIGTIKKLASNGSFSALTLRELRMLEKITK